MGSYFGMPQKGNVGGAKFGVERVFKSFVIGYPPGYEVIEFYWYYFNVEPKARLGGRYRSEFTHSLY